MKKLTLLSFGLWLMGQSLLAQGTVESYNRAFSLQDKFKDKVFYANVTPQWIGSSSLFWYVQNAPQGKTYILIDAQKKTHTHLFDHNKLALELTLATDKPVDALKLPLQSLKVTEALDSLYFVYNSYNWTYAIKQNSLKKGDKVVAVKEEYWGKVDTEREGKPVISPDKKLSAFVKDNNLYVKDLKTGIEKALSTSGTKEDYYSAYPYWSPDSKKVAVMRIHGAETRQLYLIESSPADQFQPKLQTRDYVKPGDVLPARTPVIFDIASGDRKVASNDLFKSQMDLKGFEWLPDSKSVLFEYNQRGHQVYRVLEMSAETGEIKTLVEETAKTFVNYTRYFRQTVNNGKEMIWMSERDNWNHLYLYDRLTGTVKNQITKGAWYVRDVLNVDEKKREIIFSANGMKANEDPYLVRYYRIRFDGTGLTCLTPEEGMHQAWFSDDKKYLVDVYSMVNKAPVTVLRSAADGKIIMPLEKADISELLKAGWIAPEPFVAKGRDGKTDIWGIIYRPTNFDATKKYPVIEYIYAGPGSQYTPKTFISYNRNMSALAELGFILIQLDGMGTSFRSKAFEEICYKNLKDAGFPDRILWAKAAAAKYPYMDIERMGIFGASAGGQEAMGAVLFHPEHYKAAYSSCGCHDNRMDKIWWNEQWMSYPVDSSYIASSNVENAHLLTRPLMLVVGEMDDNVDPSTTYKVCNELIKANKDFELVVLPGVPHTMGGDYGEHKRFDFFVKNLMGVTPPSWDKVVIKK
ncbi:peptidase S9B dipeptidylpeptidase IV domain protein [Paludibacter propionicigenes WB4]|uniref:Peptidase S9B dipeptidylpeptidase IV domain protein n=1 Tax=Paludibacter propionicigenes (strain DSM 17365 / JCM 13257 / WB4) TaxID=694427 RepID=E4T5J4_PALPW|nr:DPP IV N-terminal domain-containing protein [Paludibacter propionicigenes]ADQ79988.1 peptidase S9B dipeptidylpeptidase IV domain protein [Paludibacter propionicigenes WB4]